MKINRNVCVRISMLVFLSLLFRDATNQVVSDNYSIWMSNSIMERHPGSYGNWNYVTGTVLKGYQNVWNISHEDKYFDYIKSTVDAVVNESGEISGYDKSDYNIDKIKEGCALLFLYQQTGEEKYKIAADSLKQQLEEHPRTSEGGFWHKKRYPHQMWLDGLYMGSPFLAEYGSIFNHPEDISDAVKQIILMDKHAYDSVTGLYYHGWDESKEQEWADSVTGCSPSFWGRAIGWYAMAIVDVLDFVPVEHTGRDSVIDIIQRLAEGAKDWQNDTTGLWWQVVDQGGREGNYLEASVSCMFAYSLAKAVRLGYIDTSYRSVAQEAFKGIKDQFITLNTSDSTLNIIKTCCTAGLGYGRDGTYDYYVFVTSICLNDGKSLGPFISAAVELECNFIYIPEYVDLHNSVKVFPNPVKHSLQIELSGNNDQLLAAEVVSIYGEIVIYEDFVNTVKGNHFGSFDLSKLQSGVYVVKIYTLNNIITKKIIKL